MVSALVCNGSRVLTPAEAGAIRERIEKPGTRALYDLLLYSGMRLSEVHQLRDNPALYDRERGTITIRRIRKVKATQDPRNVYLSHKGRQAAEAYLLNPSIPASAPAWQMSLIRWSLQARLAHLPGYEADTNPTGITVRTTRKTWESWLLAVHPDKLPYIVLSQGYNEMVSVRPYLTIAFTPEERDAIKAEVNGWGDL